MQRRVAFHWIDMEGCGEGGFVSGMLYLLVTVGERELGGAVEELRGDDIYVQVSQGGFNTTITVCAVLRFTYSAVLCCAVLQYSERSTVRTALEVFAFVNCW